MAIIRRATNAPTWVNASDRTYIVDTINYLRTLQPNVPANANAVARFKVCMGVANNHYHVLYDQLNDQGEARNQNTGVANQAI